MTHTTKIKLNAKRPRRNYPSANWRRRLYKKKKRRLLSTKLVKLFLLLGGVFTVSILVLTGVFFNYMQVIARDLPSPDQPFGKKETTSEIYDRNGVLLYRVFEDEDRDPVDLENVPPKLIWSFLAAEDIDFYEHDGIDLKGITYCSLQYFVNSDQLCGASTVTQQLIRKTSLSDEVKLERKVKEIVLSLKIEQVRSKDEILEMYLTTVPQGSNIYGVTRGAHFYFGKELEELNLAEMTILAAIIQNPTKLSPTKSADPVEAERLVKIRQTYILDQMEKYMDKINADIWAKTGDPTLLLTQAQIDEARAFPLVFQSPNYNIQAPHFVFLVQNQLQKENFNNGRPFTLEEIETEGLRIYTTLDMEMQKIAEEQVLRGADIYGKRYGADNAALVAKNPRTGEVLALAGSKSFYAQASPAGCTVGVNCKFEPQVNVTTTLQSFGSTLKPMIYYEQIKNGVITPKTVIADVPININGYKPKNYEGGFVGYKSISYMLQQSRNIPAILLLQHFGVQNFLDDMKKWGYTTFEDPRGYGPSVAVGGADVTLLEHMQGYGVLANNGSLVKNAYVLKIEDKDGNVIYEYTPEPVQVGDARAAYIVNQILNGKRGGPGVSFDGRDIAGKTGTSESQTETLFVTYTPEIVVVGWLGNNNNARMRAGTSGFNSARPWISEFVTRVGYRIPATPFTRPEGVVFTKNGDMVILGVSDTNFLQRQQVYKNYIMWKDKYFKDKEDADKPAD